MAFHELRNRRNKKMIQHLLLSLSGKCTTLSPFKILSSPLKQFSYSKHSVVLKNCLPFFRWRTDYNEYIFISYIYVLNKKPAYEILMMIMM